MKKNFPFIFWVIIVFTIINLIQSIFTELDPDEAYYWMYAQNLNWGYFDHPPIVAILIKWSGFLFSGELGVRFLTTLLSSGTLYIIWLLANRPDTEKDILLLAFLLLAMPMFNIYGFVTTPDPPLLFFTACFFYLYRLFLEKNTWVITFLLGICMTLMLYSKYHGVLVILFTLASNLKLLRNPKFYIASVFGALLFVPHLYWQFANEFPSLKYHLVGRNNPLELKHPVNFILNQLVNFSPLLFPLWVMVLRNGIGRKPLERAFYFCIVGFWSFFLIFTVKGHPEPQWTAVLCIPFTILGYHYLKAHTSRTRLFYRLAIASVVLLILARIIVMLDFSKTFLPQFHKQAWIQTLKDKAGDLPVVFLDNYRDPSTYAFYSGEKIAALNFPLEYRRNQFDIWDLEKDFHNKEVLFFGLPEWEMCPQEEVFKVGRKNRKTCLAGPLQITQKVFFEFENLTQLPLYKINVLSFIVENPYDFDLTIDHPSWPLDVNLVFVKGEKDYVGVPLVHLIERIPAGERISFKGSFAINTDLEPGTYPMAVMITGGGILNSINSDFVEIDLVEE